jgi:hypothetical protein
LNFIDVDYCQFSDWGYQKPTRIWGSENLLSLKDKICDGKTCPNMVLKEGGRWAHKEQLGGRHMHTSTHQKWRMPQNLIEYLLSALDFKEEKFSFKREDYAVRNSFVKLIEEKFQRRAEMDCFASIKNSQCASFLTKEENALSVDWGKGGTVWLNPPWSSCHKVAKKLQKPPVMQFALFPIGKGDG